MNKRRPLIAGNWKMNGLAADGAALAKAVADKARAGAPPCELLVCPPFTLIDRAIAAVKGSPVAVGGQDCHAAVSGAHTGDVAAEMLKDLGCAYVIVGHSERRADHGETDAVVKAKAEAALRAGLVAIVCVGETEAERDAGRTEAVVARQVKGSLPAGATPANLVVAYEPVWAIGTGRTPTPADAQAVHARIRAELKDLIGEAADAVRLLYGGSVKPSNAKELMAQADIDGALVGGAALKAEDFWGIVQAYA
ncbi:triose-phosphate isomerase [Oleispirillum naphthae]|uniref:triose-phosphate isomerase n=1 Tax=Oleispirillum naphthae TaxID=2838853 RepID=UPI0030824676